MCCRIEPFPASLMRATSSPRLPRGKRPLPAPWHRHNCRVRRAGRGSPKQPVASGALEASRRHEVQSLHLGKKCIRHLPLAALRPGKPLRTPSAFPGKVTVSVSRLTVKTATRSPGYPVNRLDGDPANRTADFSVKRLSGEPATRLAGKTAIRQTAFPPCRLRGKTAWRRAVSPANRFGGEPSTRSPGYAATRVAGNTAVRQPGLTAIRHDGNPVPAGKSLCTRSLTGSHDSC